MIGSHDEDELARLFKRFYEWVIRGACFFGGVLVMALLMVFL